MRTHLIYCISQRTRTIFHKSSKLVNNQNLYEENSAKIAYCLILFRCFFTLTKYEDRLEAGDP